MVASPELNLANPFPFPSQVMQKKCLCATIALAEGWARVEHTLHYLVEPNGGTLRRTSSQILSPSFSSSHATPATLATLSTPATLATQGSRGKYPALFSRRPGFFITKSGDTMVSKKATQEVRMVLPGHGRSAEVVDEVALYGFRNTHKSLWYFLRGNLCNG